MDWKVTERDTIGDVLLLPLFAITSKPPHNSMNGLSRSAIANVKRAMNN